MRLPLSLANDSDVAALKPSRAILCALGVASAGSLVSIWAAPGVHGWLGAGLFLCLASIAVIDARRFIIPDVLVAIACLLGVADALAAAAPVLSVEAVLIPFARALALAALLYLLRAAYWRLRRQQGIGLGDVKLAAVAGLWLDVVPAALSIELAAVLALAGVVVEIVRGRRFTRRSAIPFGLYFAPAIWIAWFLQAVLQ